MSAYCVDSRIALSFSGAFNSAYIVRQVQLIRALY